MSILDEIFVPSDRAADNLRATARNTFLSLVSAYNYGCQTFWANADATPQQIAASLGTDAAEVFDLHYKIGQLVATVKPEAIAEGAALIGQCTVNQDGSVTVTEPS